MIHECTLVISAKPLCLAFLSFLYFFLSVYSIGRFCLALSLQAMRRVLEYMLTLVRFPVFFLYRCPPRTRTSVRLA